MQAWLKTVSESLSRAIFVPMSFHCSASATATTFASNLIATREHQKALAFDADFICDLKEGYATDPWCKYFEDSARGLSAFKKVNDL